MAIRQGRPGHVFTAADQGIRLRQVLEFSIQPEAVRQGVGKGLPALPPGPELAGLVAPAHGRVAGDGAFDQGQFAAAETGAFAGGEVAV
ncbi:hypothetical protein D3C85_753160 [compost metagenome]